MLSVRRPGRTQKRIAWGAAGRIGAAGGVQAPDPSWDNSDGP